LNKIRNVSNRLIIIDKITLPPGGETPLINEDLLESAEVKALLANRDIEVIHQK